MESIFRYVAAPSRCGYLDDQDWSLEHDYVRSLSTAEYQALMLQGWRRFGRMLFRPACETCRACRALRIVVERFRPSRSQRRARKTNEHDLELHIGKPSVSRAKLALYDRYHAHQAEARGWPSHPAKDAESYASSFVNQPFPVQEWCYYLFGRLVGVGYVDYLPAVPGARVSTLDTSSQDGPREPLAGGLSAIYFFYDPDLRQRSLGTWNVLRMLEEAARLGLPHLYLGYFVEGCPSMSYKTHFLPNQLRGSDGIWRDYLV